MLASARFRIWAPPAGAATKLNIMQITMPEYQGRWLASYFAPMDDNNKGAIKNFMALSVGNIRNDLGNNKVLEDYLKTPSLEQIAFVLCLLRSHNQSPTPKAHLLNIPPELFDLVLNYLLGTNYVHDQLMPRVRTGGQEKPSRYMMFSNKMHQKRSFLLQPTLKPLSDPLPKEAGAENNVAAFMDHVLCEMGVSTAP